MKNPAWHKDEIILALDLYFSSERGSIDSNNPKVNELSRILNLLSIFKEKPDELRFRNKNGVALKLANFQSFDETYSGKGMSRASKLDEELFNYYKSNVSELRSIASDIKSKVGEKVETSFYESTPIDDNTSVFIKSINEEVKRYFKKYPDKIHMISPRKFEELIADIFKDMGFNIELTNATRDGGRDIIASIRNSVTSFLTYVECKKYAPDNKIGVNLIRQVQGVHYTKMPNKSIIVTTSYFTRDARKEAQLIENALDLKDFDDIKMWLSKY